MLDHVPSGRTALHPDCAAAVRETARLLESLGHVVEAAYPAPLAETDEFLPHFFTLIASWTAAALDEMAARTGRPLDPAEFEPTTWAFAELGRACPASQYVAAIQSLERFARRMASWWEGGFELLLTSTLGEPPPHLGELRPPPDNPLGTDRALALIPFTAQFNVTGQPAISLPLHWNADGLPIGVQLVAAYGREDLLFRIAAQLEEARPWRDRRPPVHA
jgi:amidase